MAVYSADTFTALEIPTLAKMNKLWTNDASMNDGNGIGTGVINFRQVANGFVVQETDYEDAVTKTGTALIPYDDTIPTSSEGTEFMSTTFTPLASAHTLLITVVLMVYINSNLGNGAMALFKNSDTAAIASMTMAMAAGGNSLGGPYVMKHKMTAGTTSPITFKVRGGPQIAGTMTMNGIGGTRYFGGGVKCHINIREIKA